MNEDAIILLIGTIGMAGMAVAIILFAYFYQKKINAKKLELQQINDMLKASELDATYRYLEGQTTEKNRIAAELHDQIGSQLMILKLKVNESIKGKENEELGFTIDYLLNDVRRISHDLSKGMFSGNNLIQTLQDYFQGIESNSKLKIRKNFHQLHQIHNDQLGKNVYNIVQELLHNTLKYAQASIATIEINYFERDYLNLIYSDDGKGFEQNKSTEGIGIKNIKRRVELHNGQFYLNSATGKGIEVNIEIPLNE
ncbi:MAG: sensor histidine kinase [Candidatus Cyclobacteriaceae bacterium M2_1C_046]